MKQPLFALLSHLGQSLLFTALVLFSPSMRGANLEPSTLGWTQTKGGAGGRIIRVTTLDAYGPGSLGEALDQKGPRVIVFEVGGVIDLKGKSYQIKNSSITIAGQTAPAPGITLIKGGLGIAASDVIVQHLMVRPGEAGHAKKSGFEPDGIATYGGAHDVIVDHCSLTWAIDENLSASGSRFADGHTENPDDWRAATSHRITFSNNLIAEGLSNATHSKGEHSKGSLIHDNVCDVAIVRNLYANNMERNPLFKGGTRGVVVNNLISNPGRVLVHYNLWTSEWGTHAPQTGALSIVGNVAIFGSDTVKQKVLPSMLTVRGDGPCEAFIDDNQGEGPAAGIAPAGGKVGLLKVLPKAPCWPSSLKAMAAKDVAVYLQMNVGARPWNRDPIDQRILTEALAGTGKIIDSESDVGGYPKYEKTSARFYPEEWDLSTMTRKQLN